MNEVQKSSNSNYKTPILSASSTELAQKETIIRSDYTINQIIILSNYMAEGAAADTSNALRLNSNFIKFPNNISSKKKSV